MNITIAETDQERDEAYNIRMKVFVDEQQVPEEIELDEYDDSSIHFLGSIENKPIAASRLRFVENFGKLERICILKAFRGESYGKQLIEEMEKVIKEHDYNQATLNAQTHAVNFYEKLGYRTVSEEFMDAGIPHVTMVKEL